MGISVELADFYGQSNLEINVQVRNISKRTMLSASITGNLSDIDFPQASQPSSRKNELWTVGCFEIFVSQEGNAYTEYNLGFDQNWEMFEFQNYRTGKICSKVKNPPKITCKIRGDMFTQDVEFSKDIIGDRRFSLATAVKLSNGNFLYFADKHCGQKPDFHLESARTLRL
jgi:hypothetical protein